jgi:hypothetical protein
VNVNPAGAAADGAAADGAAAGTTCWWLQPANGAMAATAAAQMSRRTRRSGKASELRNVMAAPTRSRTGFRFCHTLTGFNCLHPSKTRDAREGDLCAKLAKNETRTGSQTRSCKPGTSCNCLSVQPLVQDRRDENPGPPLACKPIRGLTQPSESYSSCPITHLRKHRYRNGGICQPE